MLSTKNEWQQDIQRHSKLPTTVPSAQTCQPQQCNSGQQKQ